MPSAEQLELLVEGSVLDGWEEVSVSRSLEAVSGSFSLKVSDRSGWPIPEGAACELVLAGETVLSGFVDKLQVSITENQHDFRVDGRDATAVLVDCSAMNEPGQWFDIGLQHLVEELCDPFLIPVVSAVDTDDAGNFRSFALQSGETAYEAIERACRLRGVLPTTDGRGRLILTRARTDGAKCDLIEGVNILGAALTLDSAGRFRRYVVRGQHPGSSEIDGVSASGPEGEAEDVGARAGRTLLVLAEGAVDDAKAQRRARWEAVVRAARAQPVSVVVQGWRQVEGGPVWAPNQLTHLISPTLRLDTDLLVVGVKAKRALSGGTTTELELARPDAYQIERPPGEAESLALEIDAEAEFELGE